MVILGLPLEKIYWKDMSSGIAPGIGMALGTKLVFNVKCAFGTCVRRGDII